MKRSASQRDGGSSSASKSRSVKAKSRVEAPLLGSPNLNIAQVMGDGSFGRGNTAEEAEEADRLQAMRAARQKRTKPQDWINMTFHQYRLMEIVGTGTFGEVFKGKRNLDDKLVALKCIKQESDGKGFPVTAIREMRILRQLRHKNIVDLIEVIVDGNPTGGRLSTVALVFEYLDHDLSGLLDTPEAASQITPAIAKSFMLQLIEGVAYMHGKQIIHRDLKGANLLISNSGHLKIADWGLARRLHEMQDRYTTKVITLWYRPPELLLKAALYGPSVDMWSVGCIVAELLTRSAVFPGKNEAEQLSLIFDLLGTPTSQTWPGWTELPESDHWRELVKDNPRPDRLRSKFAQFGTEKALELLASLLVLDPRRRSTAREAFDCRYFKTKPLPTQPGSVRLNLHSCHEYEAKKRNKEGKKTGKVSHHSGGVGSLSRDNRRSNASKIVPPTSASKISQFQQQQQQQQQRVLKPSPPPPSIGLPQRPRHAPAGHGIHVSLPISSTQTGLVAGQQRQTAAPQHQHQQKGVAVGRTEWPRDRAS